jgi:MFS family permease
MVVGTLFQGITIDGYFAKVLPKEVRGTLNGAYSFCGYIGLLFFSKYAGLMFDKIGPRAPFLTVAILDSLFAILMIILVLCGKFKEHPRVVEINN